MGQNMNLFKKEQDIDVKLKTVRTTHVAEIGGG